MASNSDINSERNPTIIRFREIVRNEMLCPVLLNFDQELMNNVVGVIQNQQHNVDDITESLFKGIYQMEIDRMNFLISSYLRTRLKKLEKLAYEV